MTIQLSLEVQEVQFILGSISEQPFKQVADLWFKVKSQAESQLAQQQAQPETEPEPGLNDPEA